MVCFVKCYITLILILNEYAKTQIVKLRNLRCRIQPVNAAENVTATELQQYNMSFCIYRRMRTAEHNTQPNDNLNNVKTDPRMCSKTLLHITLHHVL